MVVQRTLDKIEELKERPHHERRTIALYGAVIIMALLFLLWGFFGVRRVGRTAIELTREQNALAGSIQVASAAASTNNDTVRAPAGGMTLTASSTNGYVDLVPAGQSANQGSK